MAQLGDYLSDPAIMHRLLDLFALPIVAEVRHGDAVLTRAPVRVAFKEMSDDPARPGYRLWLQLTAQFPGYINGQQAVIRLYTHPDHPLLQELDGLQVPVTGLAVSGHFVDNIVWELPIPVSCRLLVQAP